MPVFVNLSGICKKNLAKRCVFANEMFTLGLRLIRDPSVVNKRFLVGLLTLVLIGATGSSVARLAPVGPAVSQTNLAWFLVAFELGPWEEYLIHELTPDLERLAGSTSPTVSWMQVDQAVLLPDFAAALLQPVSNQPVLTFGRGSMALQGVAALPPLTEGLQLERSLVMPGITAPMSDRSAVSVAAVLATQRFGAAGMNLMESSNAAYERVGPEVHPGQHDVAYGAGVRFALTGEPLAGVTFEAAFQSRIDMSEFASVRGVHGSHAELDIPSRMQLGMQLQTSPRTSINLGVSQIFYSEVGAFPSRALPARFNALLGDSTSPQFDWEDLLVYSIGWTWRHESRLELSMDYRTRSQPRPSAPVLASALAPELAQNAFLLGLSKDIGDRSRLQLNAAYAPPEFAFGGNVLGVISDRLDQSLEIQALWRHQF